jgi:hypothetical protein
LVTIPKKVSSLCCARAFITKYVIFKISTSYRDEGGIERRTPHNEKIDEGVRFFYDPLATIIGISCIIGSLLSSITYFRKKYNLTIIFGILCVISVFSFFITLPNNMSFLNLHIKLSWISALLGSLCIVFINLIKIEFVRTRINKV